MTKSKQNQKADFLQRLSRLKRKEKFVALKSCSNDEVHTICECFYNLLNNGIKLDSKGKTKVKRYLKPIKFEVRKLADANVGLQTKRKLLADPQVGRGIFSILGTLASIIIPAIISATSKK